MNAPFRRPRPRVSPYARDKREARKVLASHVCTERVSRAFNLRIPGKGSIYAYSLIWSPGTLALAGDIGELTITHYQALRDFRDGLAWAASSDFHYLLGKSSRRCSFDRAGTADDIVHMANEQAVGSWRAYADDLRVWRRDRPDPRVPAAIYQGAEPDEEAAERWDSVQQWAADRPRLDFFDLLGRWGGERPERRAPDGWRLWDRLRFELCDWVPERDIFTAAGRRQIRHELEMHLGDGGPEHSATLCSRLGLDDYYGTERYSFHDILQAEAIIRGARQILALIHPYEWL